MAEPWLSTVEKLTEFFATDQIEASARRTKFVQWASKIRAILRTDFEQKGLTKQVRNCLNVGVQLPLKRFLTDDNCP